MLEILQYIFSSVWVWLGFTILLLGSLEIIGRIIIAVAYAAIDREEE